MRGLIIMEQTKENIGNFIAKGIIEYAKMINYIIDTLPDDQLTLPRISELVMRKYPDYTERNCKDLFIDIRRTKDRRQRQNKPKVESKTL